MPYTLQNAQDDLSGIVHGKTVNKITNINGTARRAAQNLLAMIDPDETRIISQITLYDKVMDYAAPADLKEKRIVDIRPQFSTVKQRDPADNLSNRMSKDFDFRRNWGSWFTVMNKSGTRYLRIKAQLTPSAASLDPLDAIGGWSAGGAASGLFLEDIIYSEGALEFNIASGTNPTAGYVQSTTITPVDLTDSVNTSSAFFELYIPTATILATIVSIDMRWGNDLTANYYNRTVTNPHFGTLQVGKNLIRIDWNGATKTGTIDPTKIDSARITVNTNGTAVSGLIVKNIFFSIARVWDIEYYSKFLFSNNAGVWAETTNSLNDNINLDTTSYNIFLYEFALAGLQQIQGKDAMADRQYFQELLHGNQAKDINGLYNDYKENNPSQKEKVTQTYYNNLGYRNRRIWGGGRR